MIRILLALLLYPILGHAEVMVNKNFDTPLVVIKSGLLSPTPIISDATFAIIAKKNNLSEKNFSQEDLRKLDLKFSKVVATLEKDKVFEKIEKIAPKYGVSPESVAACIIGEHVFNVTITDQFQSYFISIYSKWIDKHNSIQHVYLDLLKEPDIAVILKSNTMTDYEKWDTIFAIYNKKYRGTKEYPNKNFIFTFFNPYGAGLTYGLGQLSPIRVLLTNDIAVKLGGLKRIAPTDTESLYFATLDVDTNINYVAATVVASIANYKEYANFDISNNIGVIATLYNLGNEKIRAQKLCKIDECLLKENKKIILPTENFYGWYMNKKENEIKQLVNREKIAKLTN
jgi:hypothetical protein